MLLPAAAGLAQNFTQRGFLEGRSSLYPLAASNDRARAVGEALFRYEGFLTASSAVQLAGAIDLRADTHHQVERELRFSWQDRERRRPTLSVRRFSVNYHRGGVTIEGGKQFVRWGKTDILNPTDRFAPRDFLTVVDNEFLAVTAARMTWEEGENTLDIVFSPRFTPSKIPLLDQRWTAAPENVQLRDAGVTFPGGPQTGVRWNHAGVAEYSVSFYQGFNHLPSFETQLSLSPGGVVQADLTRFHPRMIMAGGDLAAPLPWFTLKGEAAHFSSTDERADEYLLYVVQLERQTGEWSIVGGYAGEVVTQDGTQSGEFAPDRGLTRTILGRAGYTIDSRRNLAIEAAVRQSGDGVWTKFEYSQAFGQNWRVTGSVTFIAGDRADFLGQYRRNSHGVLVVRYSF
jgi:hypothetical protein